MIQGSYRETWTEVSLDAIYHNVTAFKNHIDHHTKLMAVVKADGYGHGAVEVAQESLKAGADYLAVAILDEAIQLRDSGIDTPLLVLGYTHPDGLRTAIEQQISLTVFTKEGAEQVKIAAESLQMTARVHLKIESGMNRIGIATKEEAVDVAKTLHSSFVILEGAFTHFADADNTDPAYTEMQFHRFNQIISYLRTYCHIPIVHCCNTAGTIAYPDMHLDMVRVGIGLYGLYPETHLKELIDLKQAMSLKTKPVYVKTVDKDTAISYGLTFTTERKSVIATMPIGYADGFSRLLSNRGNVVINGEHAPIVGRICMDQSMIDVTDIVEDVSLNDVITIFGEPSEGYIAMEEVANLMGTIHYETACLIGKRVPRIYMSHNEVVNYRGLMKKEIVTS
ncbi:alanine racemase [Oceanobacillus kimchii]|uniref:Alanine racemase n=1 Tax=Oceanobacillus kimchii TaxID=746691 RepID=A0ABQ5TM85_9BACI|nr:MULTISPECIES: alanine racemase [Oceanobacillus]MBT2599699.1 alanine racemase [Oceanobacillus sp. ISL-74]MCT1576895.1 alanine racemase [Oceanobacillus kimchii]MCT2134965.1 alanine racemase [Oceanobacillus kimchii]GLO67928.1 alanine racemase [Oceanobacillus kimchii]